MVNQVYKSTVNASRRSRIFTFIHQKAGSNNRKAKKDKRTKKTNTKTQEHGAKSTQSATN